MRISFILTALLLFSCKTQGPTSRISETTAEPRTKLSEAICVDPEMLALSDSAKATFARIFGPTAAGIGVLGNAPIDGKSVEPKIAVLNSCLSGTTGETINVKFSFDKPYDPSKCRCVISAGVAPAGFQPALSCGADKSEAENPSCMFVRMKGCAETNLKQILYAPVGKRLSCINHAKKSYPRVGIADFRNGNTDDLLLAVIDKAQLRNSKCDAAVITKQQWEVFLEQRPGFKKNAEVFGAIDTPGNLISCADPEDTEFFQDKAFAGDGIDHPCFASARSGFGSCSVATKSVNQ